MNINLLLSDKTLDKFKEGKATYEETLYLESIARKVLMKEINSSCKNCYVDALIELNVMYRNNTILFDQRMIGPKYLLKRGCCFPLGFGSDRMLVRQNCTEELAIEFLSMDKKNINYFDIYPKEWEKEVDTYIQEKSSEPKK